MTKRLLSSIRTSPGFCQDPLVAIDDRSALLSDVTPENSRQLLLAALEEFAVRGYHATTTRDIARRVGLSPAAVYVHYPSKAHLLLELSRTGHRAALRVTEEALDGEGDPPVRLRRFVRAFAAWHADNQPLARVIQYELRALPADGYEEVAALRRRIERLLQAELRRGRDSGAFQIDDLTGTALAILSLCIDIARWYTPGGRRRPAAIGELYAELALRMVNAKD
jgi:AcrR family transcriptional regulator